MDVERDDHARPSNRRLFAKLRRACAEGHSGRMLDDSAIEPPGSTPCSETRMPVATTNYGSQTGSHCWQIVGHIKPCTASISAGKCHMRRQQAPCRDPSGVPSKQRVAGSDPAGRAQTSLACENLSLWRRRHGLAAARLIRPVLLDEVGPPDELTLALNVA